MNIKKAAIFGVSVMAALTVINAVPQLKNITNSGNKYFN